MSVFVDTGVFYAAFDSAAPRHQEARSALTTVLTDAQYGRTMTSDYVYDETVTLTLKRTGRTQRAISIGKKLRSTDGSNAVSMIHVTEPLFDAAVNTFERYDDQRLSFTDAVTVAIVDTPRADRVLSFDDNFDGIVPRLDPATVA